MLAPVAGLRQRQAIRPDDLGAVSGAGHHDVKGLLLTLALFAASEPDTAAVLRLFSYYGFAHGCPISATTLLTARHVATLELGTGVRAVTQVWANGHGESGSAWLLDYDSRRDLALMGLDPPVTHWYPLATDPPAPAERVTMLGYNLRGDFEPQIG